MSQPIKRHLKVGNAPQDDEGILIIRMHPDDLPKGIKWNSYIHLLVRDGKIACRVRNNELAEVPHPRIHQININRKLRDVLRIKSGKIYDFYVTRASSWKAPSYVIRYHPNRSARRYMLFKVLGAIGTILIAAGGALYYLLGYQ